MQHERAQEVQGERGQHLRHQPSPHGGHPPGDGEHILVHAHTSFSLIFLILLKLMSVTCIESPYCEAGADNFKSAIT